MKPLRNLAPWAALAGLWFAFELPMALAPNRVDPTLLRPTGDALVLLTVLCLNHWYLRRSVRRLVGLALTVVALLFAIVRLDRAVFFFLTRTEPLLYDQFFMLRHLTVLVWDLFSARLVVSLLCLAALCVGAGAGLRALLRRAAPLLADGKRAETRAVGGVLWAAVASLTAFGPTGPTGPSAPSSPSAVTASNLPWIRWMAPDLARNAAESRRIYRVTQKHIDGSDAPNTDAIRLVRKPDVALFFVESYGKLIAEDPAMRRAWVPAVTALQARLEASGWHLASAYSTAPVSGGRSWLAVGSILMGRAIRYESVFRHLIQEVGRIPTLPSFFERQGYETVLLAPSDRSRLGVTAENHYGYDHYLRFADFDYRGPRKGWGVVPDQYALGYAEDHVLAGVTRPLFVHFHMVSSHAPWDEVPAYLPDYRSWNDPHASLTAAVFPNELATRLEQYTREAPRQDYMGALTEPLRAGFVKSVLYDLRVVEDFLRTRRRDSLVIVMGDHQPPVVAPESVDFDVPVHVFAQDRELLREFEAQGFTKGLALPADGLAVVEHAGLFSLFVRALGRSCGDGSPLPPYFPHGAAPGPGDAAPGGKPL